MSGGLTGAEPAPAVPSLAGSTSAGSAGEIATACYPWLWPCTARSTWYLANNGARASRTPPSELCPLQVLASRLMIPTLP